jgi:molybdate transport system substrate-binding protein
LTVKVGVLAASIGLSLLTIQPSLAAEINAFVTGAARRAYETLAPQFERATGHKLVSQFELPPALIKKVDAGEPFDVIILSYDVEGLIKRGLVVPDSRTVLGRIGVGVAVRQGAPKPDFSTVEAFKRALLDAKTIATSGEGSSGRYVASLIERLGIAEQVKPKIRSGGAGTSAQLVSRGEVDFAVIGLPPLIGTPNIEWLGYIPDEINSWLVFSGGLGANAKEPEAGRALLKFLTTPAALAVFKDNGLEPPSP